MVDIAHTVGRTLRARPGHEKPATPIVPVFPGPGERPDEMVTSDAYKTLSKNLGALRAHDTDTIEALADPRVRSGQENTDDLDQEHDGVDREDILEDGTASRSTPRCCPASRRSRRTSFLRRKQAQEETRRHRGIDSTLAFLRAKQAEAARLAKGLSPTSASLDPVPQIPSDPPPDGVPPWVQPILPVAFTVARLRLRGGGLHLPGRPLRVLQHGAAAEGLRITTSQAGSPRRRRPPAQPGGIPAGRQGPHGTRAPGPVPPWPWPRPRPMHAGRVCWRGA